MRPHLLTVEAMGPFAGKVTVDFDDLAHGGLFLIHGRTGSGKTSLLDALCFALYGEVPGARGDRGLRSDHAAPEATPRATLEFSAHGGRYRVEREPFHEAPKRRGGGVTVRNPTATLVRLDAGHEATIATKPSEVKAEVLRLVGLDARQFQQVILLPQGQFEAVLRGKAETREGLLKTLFHTVGFEQLADWLADQAREKRRAVGEGRRELGVLTEEARRRGAELAVAAPTPAGTRPEPDEPLFTGVDAGGLDQAGLDRLADRAELKLIEADAALAAAEAALLAHRGTLESTVSAAQRWDERHAATAEHARLHAAAPQIESGKLALARSALAEPIAPSLAEVGLRTEAVRAADAAGSRGLAAAGRAQRGLARTLPAVAALTFDRGVPRPTELATARAALAAERATLLALRETVDQRDRALRSAADHRAEVAGLRRQLVAAAAELEQLRLAAARAAADLAAATTARDQLPGLAEAATAAEVQARAAARLATARTQLSSAEAELLRRRETAVSAREAHLTRRSQYLDGIAAVLAATLRPGEPCGVCGAAEHPHPAEPGAGAVAADAVADAEARAQAAQDAVEAHLLVVADIRQQVAAHEATAGPAAGDPTGAEQAARAAAAACATARTAAGEVDRLGEHHAGLLARLDRLEALRAQGATAIEGAGRLAEAADADAAAAETRLVAVLGPAVDLRTASRAVDALDRALEALATQASGLEEARGALDQAAARLAADLEASPFADEAEARAALLAHADRARLTAAIETHQLRFAQVIDRLNNHLLVDLPTERPAVDVAEAAAAIAERGKAAAVAHRTRIHGARERIDQLATEHRARLATLLPLESDAELHEAVANRCAGKVAPKVSLQRWVLATYLEGICEHANRRLATMTAGRYQLRVERDAVHAASKAGLDLWVLDAHTGTERPVSTLSGGETFQASLALALGVADSVEARTGGVRLEALFVDEGFGTLDPESLQLAMDELDGLREGGRMVGLISHVGALRERIRVGIEVTQTDLGSTVRLGQIDAA